MNEDLKAKLLKVFPQAALEIGGVYAEAIARMTVTELLALDDTLNAKKAMEAMDAVRAKMTAEELAAEKAGVLVDLTRKMAEDNAQAWSVARAIAIGGLKAGIAIALAGFGF